MGGPPDSLPEPLTFEWDDGNAQKNRERHGVLPIECEELFGETPILLADDAAHSTSEPRQYALGRTRLGRRLFVVFTLRDRKLRVISARDMSRKEPRIYDQALDEAD